MLSIKLIDTTGEKIDEYNNEFEEFSKLDYIKTIVPFYFQYEKSIFRCHNEPLDLVINHYNCTFTIPKFNNMRYNKFLKTINFAYYKITLFEHVLNQIAREEKESITEFNSEDCPICFCTLDSETHILSCLHRFHIKCIKKHLETQKEPRLDFDPIKYHKECPMCRNEIFQGEIEYLKKQYTNNRK